MQDSKQIFLDFLRKHKVQNSVIEKFEKYETLIQEKNQKFNLVSEKTINTIWTTHFLDSVLLSNYNDLGNSYILDFGSGAGFPGIPLKIICYDMKLYCVESIKKKALFITFIKDKLNLSDTEILTCRFENITEDLNGTFDHIVVRAVKMTDQYFEKAFKLLKPAGSIILYKSKVIDDEVDKIKNYQDCASTEIIRNEISGLGRRAYIIVKKHG
ncbi:MAG: 16S rRNA (guanine(527)-N(7))-methyltransferase RsmG [Candidatus Cloacimonetes bacterium]|nr:16S rRNA (guanine(527)-N(7))-methyltransferase RsmG [Candidatus Cloacimonadota bacterium]